MEMTNSFVSTFIELSAFMVLWCKFSLKKEKVLLKNLAIMFISSFVMTITTCLPSYYSIALSYLTLICLMSLFYNKRFVKSFVEFAITLLIIMILQLISMYILKAFTSKIYLKSFEFDTIVQFCVLLFSVIIYYFIPQKNIYSITAINSKILCYIVINFIGYAVICKIVWEYNKEIILNNVIVFMVMIIIIFFLNLFLCYNIVKIDEEKKIIEIHNKYSPIIENITEEIRGKQHEFKNYLNTINSIIQVANEGELKENLRTYIKSLKNVNKDIENIFHIDNLIVRSIIYSKLSDSGKNKIDFKYFVSNDLSQWKVKDYELSEILTNILNNAFEAARDSSDKIVTLNIFNEKDKNIIEITNSSALVKLENINKMFNRGFSTKEGQNRGYGLYNVKKIVESNGGKIQLSFENNNICLKILF
jgi:soluble cytochrome b562